MLVASKQVTPSLCPSQPMRWISFTFKYDSGSSFSWGLFQEGEGAAPAAGCLTKGWVFWEALHTHRLDQNHLDNGGNPRFQGFGVVFQLLAWTPVDLFPQLCKLARHMGRVAVQNWWVASCNAARMVENDHLEPRVGQGRGRALAKRPPKEVALIS